MCRRGPFTLAHDRQARAGDDEMQAGARRGATTRAVEMLTTPGPRCMIGRGQVEVQHPEDRRHKARGLTERQVDDETERQGRFEGEIGRRPLPSTRADAHGRPGGDRDRGSPHGDLASLDERSVVLRPVPNAIFSSCPSGALSTACRDHAPAPHLVVTDGDALTASVPIGTPESRAVLASFAVARERAAATAESGRAASALEVGFGDEAEE